MEILRGKKVTTNMHMVEDYTKWLSEKLLGFECKVRFVKMNQPSSGYKILAQYGNKTLDFVVDALGQKWFELEGSSSPKEEQTSLIIHELAHEGGTDHLPHTGDYVHRLAELGAKATHVAIRGAWWDSYAECTLTDASLEEAMVG